MLSQGIVRSPRSSSTWGTVELTRYPVVAVVGLPGALTPTVAAHIHRMGWAIHWPRQNTGVHKAQEFVHNLAQNYEIRRLHEMLCAANDVNQLAARFPRWYRPTPLGPDDYVAKFDTPFLLSDVFLPVFLDWWGPRIDVVVDVQATSEETLRVMSSSSFYSGPRGDQLVTRSLQAWQERYEENLRMFSHTCSLTNEDVRSGRFDAMSAYLRMQLSGKIEVSRGH